MSTAQQRWTSEAVRQGRRLAMLQTKRVIYRQGKIVYPARQMNRETAIKFFQAMLGFPPWAAAIAADEYARVWADKPKPNPNEMTMIHNPSKKISKQIVVVIKRVGQPAKIGLVASTLEGWHTAIGGNVMVQLVPFDPSKRSIELALDEDGISKGLPVNVVHPYWGPILGNLFVMKRGPWKPGEAEEIARQLNAMPQNAAMNPRNPTSEWSRYEYKITYVKRTATIKEPGRAPIVVQPGEFVIWEGEKQAASETITSRFARISQGGSNNLQPFYDAQRLAEAKSNELESRNPNPVRVLDTTGRCVSSFLHGKEVPCTTEAAAENPLPKLSRNAKIGLAVGGVALLGGIVYLMTRSSTASAAAASSGSTKIGATSPGTAKLATGNAFLSHSVLGPLQSLGPGGQTVVSCPAGYTPTSSKYGLLCCPPGAPILPDPTSPGHFYCGSTQPAGGSGLFSNLFSGITSAGGSSGGGSAVTHTGDAGSNNYVITGSGQGTVPGYQSNGATTIILWLPQDSIGWAADPTLPPGYSVQSEHYMGPNAPYSGTAAVKTNGNQGNADGYDLNITTSGNQNPASMDVHWINSSGQTQTTTINFSGPTGM